MPVIIALIVLVISAIPATAATAPPASRSIANLEEVPTDAVIDHGHGLLWAVYGNAHEVVAIDLASGSEVATIPVSRQPERMGLSPDGGTLVVALLISGHTYYGGDDIGMLAVIDTATTSLLREVRIGVDPWDVVVADDGYAYAASGSNQWTDLIGVDLRNGSTVSSTRIRHKCYLDIHPTGGRLFWANTDSYPSDIGTAAIDGGSISGMRDSPYHGTYPMSGRVWATGGYVVVRGGGAFTADGNLTYVGPVSSGGVITDAAFSYSYLATIEGSVIALRDLGTRAQLHAWSMGAGPDRIFLYDDEVITLDGTILRGYPSPIDEQVARLELPATVDEGDGSLPDAGAVVLDESVEVDVTFALSPSGGELGLPATVVVPAGETRATFDLMVSDDELLTGSRRVDVAISADGWHARGAKTWVLDDEPVTISLDLPNQVDEGGVASASLTLDVAPDADLAIDITVDSVALEVPSVVVVPSGVTGASFSVGGLEDGAITGTRTVTLGAGIGGGELDSGTIDVIDNEEKAIAVTARESYLEGTGSVAASSWTQVTLTGTLDEPLTVSLTSDDPGEVSVGPTVQIPAGSLSATFPLVVPEDTDTDGSQVVVISASAAGFIAGEVEVVVHDDDLHHVDVVGLPTSSVTGVDWPVTVTPRTVDGRTIAGGHSLRFTAVEPGVTIEPSSLTIPSYYTSSTITIEPMGADDSVTIEVRDGGGGLIQTLPTITLVEIDTAADLVGHYADMAMEPGGDVVWMTEPSTRSLVRFDIDADLERSRQVFDRVPESLTFDPNGGRLFVALLHGAHSSYWWEEDQSGEVVTVSLASGWVVNRYAIPTDPWDLAASASGDLFVPSGSGQWTDLLHLDADSGEVLATVGTRQRSYVALNPSGDALFAGDTDVYPSDVERHPIVGGVLGAGVDSPYHGDHRLGGKQWVTPDGRFVISARGSVLTADVDLSWVADLGTGTKTDVSFGNTYLLCAAGNDIQAYDLETMAHLGSLKTAHAVDRVWVSGPDMIWCSRVAGTTVFYSAPSLVTEPLVSVRALGGPYVESDGVLAGGLEVGVPGAVGEDLVVTLTGGGGVIDLPGSVTIPAGENAVTLDLVLVDDEDLNGPRLATVSPSADGYYPINAAIVVGDDETATLTLTALDPVTEGEGILPGQVVIRSDEAPTGDVTVALTSSDESEILLPDTAVIAAGTTAVTVDMQVVDDQDMDGSVTVELAARVPGWTEGLQEVTVHDDEATTIQLSVAGSNEVWEGTGVDLRIAFPGRTTSPVMVTLTPTDPTRFLAPSFVTVPAGVTSYIVGALARDDAEVEANRLVQVTVSAPGFETIGGPAVMTVHDDDVAEMTASAPRVAVRGTTVSVAIETRNASGELILGSDRTAALGVARGLGTCSASSIAIGPDGRGQVTATLNGAGHLLVLAAELPGGIVAMTEGIRLIDLAPSFVLNHAFTDAVVDDRRGRLWLSVQSSRTLRCIDLADGGELASWSTSLIPESLDIEADGDAVYAAMVTGGRSPYWWDEDQTGGVRRYDADGLSMTHDRTVAIDPCDIEVTSEGIAYLSGGSGQWTDLMALDVHSGSSARGGYPWRQRQRITMHPNERLLGWSDGDGGSPTDSGVIQVDGLTVPNSVDSPYHGGHGLGWDIWCAANGAWMVVPSGTILNTETPPLDIGSFEESGITHLQSDEERSILAAGQELACYATDTRAPIGKLGVGFPVDRIFRWGDELVLLSERGALTYVYIIADPFAPRPAPSGRVVHLRVSGEQPYEIVPVGEATVDFDSVSGMFVFDLHEVVDALFTIQISPYGDG